jgi:uncharacterized protein YxjI
MQYFIRPETNQVKNPVEGFVRLVANKIAITAAFGDLLYDLRVHINFVRDNLLSRNSL